MNAKPHHFLQMNLNRSKRQKETSQIRRMDPSKFGQEKKCFNKFLSGQYWSIIPMQMSA